MADKTNWLLRGRTLDHEREEDGSLTSGDPVWLEADSAVTEGILAQIEGLARGDKRDEERLQAALDRVAYDPDVLYRDRDGNLVALDHGGDAEEGEPAGAIGGPAGTLADPFPEGGSKTDLEDWVGRGGPEESGARAQHALDVELGKGEKARSTVVTMLREKLGLS